MTKHFLFQKSLWEGSGEITLPLAEKPLPLRVTWTVGPIDDGRFRAVQEVVVEDHEPMTNTFTLGKCEEGEFQLFLENTLIGMFAGTGVYDEQKVAWEFSHKDALVGFEVYERKGKGEYAFRAEYMGGDGFSTIISGTLQRKER